MTVIINKAEWSVIVEGREISPHLARASFLIIKLLARRPGIVRTWGEIADVIGDRDTKPENVAKAIDRLRQRLKIEGIEPIQTLRCIGYRWDKSIPVTVIEEEIS